MKPYLLLLPTALLLTACGGAESSGEISEAESLARGEAENAALIIGRNAIALSEIDGAGPFDATADTTDEVEDTYIDLGVRSVTVPDRQLELIEQNPIGENSEGTFTVSVDGVEVTAAVADGDVELVG